MVKISDYDSSLPIFSRATTNPVIVSKDTNANGASNPISFALSDGSIELDLVTIDSGFGSTPVAIPIAGKYEAVPTTYATGDAVPLLLDANGRLQSVMTMNTEFVDDTAFTPETSKVLAFGCFADETSPDSVTEGDIGIPRMTLDRKQLVRIVGASDANRWDVDGSGHGQFDLAAVSVTAVPVSKDSSANAVNNAIFVAVGDGTSTAAVSTAGANNSLYVTHTDGDNVMPTMDVVARAGFMKVTDGSEVLAIDASNNAMVNINAQSLTAVKISKDSAANTETNPIYVYNVSTIVSGNEFHDYDTDDSLGAGLTGDHDAAIGAGTTGFLKQVIASASGAMKVSIKSGPTASLTTHVVAFTSMANPVLDITFAIPIEVAGGATNVIRVARKNREGSSMDVYSTIIYSKV